MMNVFQDLLGCFKLCSSLASENKFLHFPCVFLSSISSQRDSGEKLEVRWASIQKGLLSAFYFSGEFKQRVGYKLIQMMCSLGLEVCGISVMFTSMMLMIECDVLPFGWFRQVLFCYMHGCVMISEILTVMLCYSHSEML